MLTQTRLQALAYMCLDHMPKTTGKEEKGGLLDVPVSRNWDKWQILGNAAGPTFAPFQPWEIPHKDPKLTHRIGKLTAPNWWSAPGVGGARTPAGLRAGTGPKRDLTRTPLGSRSGSGNPFIAVSSRPAKKSELFLINTHISNIFP